MKTNHKPTLAEKSMYILCEPVSKMEIMSNIFTGLFYLNLHRS